MSIQINNKKVIGNIESKVKMRIILAVLSLIGMAVVLLSTSRYGVGLSPDSVHYISAARSLLMCKGYSHYDGSLFVCWPPLFPTLLAIAGLLGIEPLDGARFINAFAFGLIIFAAGQLFLKHIRSRALVLLGIVSILLSMPLLLVSTMAWTEPLFILFVVLFINFLLEFLDEGRLLVFFSLSILAALSCLQRYIGITVVLTGFVLIIFLMPKASLLRRLKYAIAFGVISITPSVIWIIRNYSLTATFTGGRTPSSLSFFQNAMFALDVFTTWFMPHQVPFPMRLIGVGFVVSILMTMVVFSHYKSDRQANTKFVQIQSVGTFVLIYTLYLIVSATNVAFDRIDDRLLAPIYVFTMFLVFMGIENASTRAIETISLRHFQSYRIAPIIAVGMILSGVIANEFLIARYFSPDGILESSTILNIRISQAIVSVGGIVMLTMRRMVADSLNRLLSEERLRNSIVIGLCAIWLMYPFVRVSKNVWYRVQNGAGGYNSVIWRESSLMAWLRNHPLEGRIFSNAPPGAIYIFTGMSTEMIPRKHHYASPVATTEDLLKFKKFLALDSSVYLVWFEKEMRSYLYTPKELHSIFDMEVVATCSDGAIYLLKQK